jgi:small subunit ribosomal protein S16
VLRIRLRRTGARKRPSYRVVVAEANAPRDGRYVDHLGFYDPLTDPTTIEIDQEKAKAWIQKGAKPSDRVAKLLNRIQSD